MPGRWRAFSRVAWMAAACAASRASSVTRRPARNATRASAVPKAPAPAMTIWPGAHARAPLRPLPTRGAAVSSRGQRGRAARSGRRLEPGGEPLGSGPGDHRAVVGAEARRRGDERETMRSVSAERRARSPLFAATPPATTSAVGRAVAERLDRVRHAVRHGIDGRAWNEALRSAMSAVGERREPPRPRAAAPSSGRRTRSRRPERPSAAAAAGTAPGRPRRPRARRSARRDRAGRAASRPCRTPRRARRRWSCRAAGSGRRPPPPRAAYARRRRAAAGRETRRRRSARAVSAWPSRWLSGSSGVPCTAAMARAVATPTSSPPIRPGPAVTATASRSVSATPASISAARMTPSSASTCARAAISGTTPP